MRPENIGVSTVDHNVDRVVGTRSRQLWETVKGRQEKKKDVIRDNPGTTGKDLSIRPEGGYRVMDSKERERKDDFRTFHNQKLAKLAGGG